MYWADLSRLGTGLAGVAGAIFQLISSLAVLGLKTIERAREHAPRRDGVGWRTYVWAHSLAVFSLTLLVPFLSLAIIGVALSVPLARMPQTVQATVVGVIGAILVTWLLGLSLIRRAASVGNLGRWLLGILVAVITGSLVARHYLSESDRGQTVFVVAWAVLFLIAIGWLGIMYERRRTPAAVIAFSIGIPAAFSIGWSAFAPSDVELAHRTLRSIEFLFLALAASWILMLVAGTISGFASFVDKGTSPVPAKGGFRVGRASWTGATTLVLSTASVSCLALVLWSGLNAVFTASLPTPFEADSHAKMDSLISAASDSARRQPRDAALMSRANDSYVYRSLAPYPVRHDAAWFNDTTFVPMCLESLEVPPGEWGQCKTFSQKSVLPALLSLSGATGLLPSVMALALVLIAAILLCAPAILRELNPLHDEKSAGARSQRLGVWLSTGFEALRIAAIVAFVFVFVGSLFAIWSVFAVRYPSVALASTALAWLQATSDPLLFKAGSAIGASTVGILVLLSRFGSVARVVRPALDVMLDVDNYLKERPEKATPRARILERYVSLLRYLCSWRNTEQRPYDAIVIVAHSQGAVISAECLRFHAKRGFRELDALRMLPTNDPSEPEMPPVFLMTMGAPLRQLYGRSFPTLFRWLSEKKDGPDCSDIGVQLWLNVFRSGDYVGRSLWLDPDQRKTYEAMREFEHRDSLCFEHCLGAGAHTHYWDSVAKDVSYDLDALMAVVVPPGK